MSHDEKTNELVKGEADRIEQLLFNANNGDRAAVSELRKEMDDFPWLVRIAGGDLADTGRKRLLDGFCGSVLGTREAIEMQIERMRTDLEGDGASPLERLLIDRIVTCWLHLTYCDHQFAGTHEQNGDAHSFRQRQLDRAQMRYLWAIKSLTNVRKLLSPMEPKAEVGPMSRLVCGASTIPSPLGSDVSYKTTRRMSQSASQSSLKSRMPRRSPSARTI